MAVYKPMNEEGLLYTSVHAPDNLEKCCIFCSIHHLQSSCLIRGNTNVYTLGSPYILLKYDYHVNPGTTRYSTCPDRPWGPPSLLYNGYCVLPGGKVWPGRAVDHSPLLMPWSWKSRANLYPPSGPQLACNGNTIYLFYDYHVIMQNVDLSNVIVFQYRFGFQSQWGIKDVVILK